MDVISKRYVVDYLLARGFVLGCFHALAS